MTRVDQYKHLNRENELGINLGMEEVAEFVVSKNYGSHRFLSAMVHELRDQQRANDHVSPMADEIERMLDEGIYY